MALLFPVAGWLVSTIWNLGAKNGFDVGRRRQEEEVAPPLSTLQQMASKTGPTPLALCANHTADTHTLHNLLQIVWLQVLYITSTFNVSTPCVRRHGHQFSIDDMIYDCSLRPQGPVFSLPILFICSNTCTYVQGKQRRTYEYFLRPPSFIDLQKFLCLVPFDVDTDIGFNFGVLCKIIPLVPAGKVGGESADSRPKL